jgi:hypothetical protein
VSPNELNSLLRRQPFVPFRLHLTGGTSYEIADPRWMIVGATTAALGARRDPASPIYDEPVFIALRHVTHVEPIEAADPNQPPVVG